MPSFMKDSVGRRAGNEKRLARELRPRTGGTAYRLRLERSARDERGNEIHHLKQALYRRDAHIALLHRDLTGVLESRSWRLMAPLRGMGQVYRRLRWVLSALKSSHRDAGGILPLARKVMNAARSRGVVAVFRQALGLPPVPARKLDHRPSLKPVAAGSATEVADEPGAPGGASEENPPATILFVSHEASRTGAPILLIEVAKLIKRELGLRCLFLLRTGGALEDEFRAVGPTLVLGQSNVIDTETMRTLSKQNIGLVYSNTATNGLVQRGLKFLQRPILCHMHELGYSVERHFGAENLRAVLATTDLFLAGSGAVARYLLEERNVPPQRVTVAYPFVKVADNRARATSLRAPRLPTDGIVVGACGTIGWRKGTDLFVQLAQQILRRSNQKIYFVWVGGPIGTSEFAQLEHDAVQMGIRDRIIFTGAVDDHIPYFAQFDIFVLTSREDPFPLVALDAASLGMPVLCFDKSGGTPELVEADAGVIIPYMDIDGMADTVLELSTDTARRRKLGEAAAAKVQAGYDVDASGRSIAQMVNAHFVSETPGLPHRPAGSQA